MIKKALKNTATKIITVIFLCIAALFLSAFTYDDNASLYMTRLEMAKLMEEVLNNAPMGIDEDFSSAFSDLSKEKHNKIKKTLKYNLMMGFPDGTFKPNTPIRNLEVVAYLQKLSNLLRDSAPESNVTKQLFRLLSYSEEPGFALDYGSLNSIKELDSPNKIATKKLLEELKNKLATKVKPKDTILSGKIIDSISGKPVASAFISANGQAKAVDLEGSFSFCLSRKSKTAEVFATANGYMPTEICKDLNLGSDITIRLRRKKSRLQALKQ